MQIGMTWASSEPFLSEKHPSFLIQEPGKIYEKGGNSMKTGLTKKQKNTELYFNAKDPMAEIYTHDTKLKRRLTAPYSEERKSNARKWAKENGLRGKYDGRKRMEAETGDDTGETLRN